MTEYLDNVLDESEGKDMDDLNEKINGSVRGGLEEVCPEIVNIIIISQRTEKE